MKKLVVLTGAGISAESGIKTFRDADGLWENHSIEEVATPEAWRRNPDLVLRFYNQRRAQLHTVEPNEGHLSLARLEKYFEVYIITQNVDNLHERAGSTRVLHLHGELLKVHAENNSDYIIEWPGDLNLGDCGPQGGQLRPHIVWFGEPVPKMQDAISLARMADVFMVVGTSLLVYPAAGLMAYAPRHIPFYYIDPKPSVNFELNTVKHLEIIAEPASSGVAKAASQLISLLAG